MDWYLDGVKQGGGPNAEVATTSQGMSEYYHLAQAHLDARYDDF